ncbi:hypothetical protein EV141_1888 [Microcella putealis]|uniref:Uncharacterized protein n=1 Tax=Microcella putealis TaxID=337005 RepID=A0A4Q7LPD5_9MICO|nr:hypothetical protein [Microcella putealis]RZS56424.1 hypothetical protein EV141_1888 [Microcella putealis]TQM27090.1 hypothetical protein BJ957_0513 [Microcella putealis]
MTDPSLDPRYPRVFQRGGDGSALPAPSSRSATTAPPTTAPPTTAPPATARPASALPPRRETSAPRGPEVDPAVLVTGAAPVAVGRAPLEVIVVGNPWMRALWTVGALTLVGGIALTVAAEFAFSALQTASTYDPAAFLPARLMQVLGLPLIIAGTLGLVAATVLRLVAWRPAAVRDVDAG